MIDKKTYLLSLGITLSAFPVHGKEPVLKIDPEALKIRADSDTEDSLFLKSFHKQCIYNDDFVRNTFYTWTTTDQIEELRQKKSLLSRSKSKNNEWSQFDQALRDTTFSKLPIAKLLQDDMFKNKRFGWTNSWATVMGWKDEQYGDQLLKIVLDETAIIGIFNEEDKAHPFRFYYMNGKPAEESAVIRSKNKLAAVYHISERKVKKSQHVMQGYTTYRKGKRNEVPFREFVILNESMIKSWSYGTPDVLSELDAEISLLKSASSKLAKNHYKTKYHMCSYVEFEKFEHDNFEFEWFLPATCFENDYYIKKQACVDRIIRRLEQVKNKQGLPLTK
jgi:hypothetical protein